MAEAKKPNLDLAGAEYFEWFTTDGTFIPETTVLDPDRLKALGVHMRNSGQTVKTYMSTLYALELCNPELMGNEEQKVKVENDLIHTINGLNPDVYSDARLKELRDAVPRFETSPPPVFEALKAIFEHLEEDGTVIDIKARAYGTIRALYLAQTGQSDKLPRPIE